MGHEPLVRGIKIWWWEGGGGVLLGETFPGGGLVNFWPVGKALPHPFSKENLTASPLKV